MFVKNSLYAIHLIAIQLQIKKRTVRLLLDSSFYSWIRMRGPGSLQISFTVPSFIRFIPWPLDDAILKLTLQLKQKNQAELFKCRFEKPAHVPL